MKKPCIDCGRLSAGSRCARHQQALDAEKHGDRYKGDWRRYSTMAIARHLNDHGPLCPGFDAPPHYVEPRDFVCDHDLGPMCRACNGRKAATVDKARASIARGERR